MNRISFWAWQANQFFSAKGKLELDYLPGGYQHVALFSRCETRNLFDDHGKMNLPTSHHHCLTTAHFFPWTCRKMILHGWQIKIVTGICDGARKEHANG
jgi:hypothetical protein